ncbi:amino-acid permease [Podospora fimiseda]|uniref:Amino-acid permease n=1 Tax=Podospora fimiseda TaxID=252190 RepID=A0AAN7GXY7_9PEZI|nr:amino-acid permease [Podospora fimiseda]
MAATSFTEKGENELKRTGSGVLGTSSEDEVGQVHEKNDFERQKELEGQAAFKRLGWKRLTIVLVVTAVALGSLSLPSVFATLGMVAGVILTIFIGFIAMYTSYVIGQMKLKYPEIHHYGDAGRMMFGDYGYFVITTMFVLQLVFTTGSHVLTGAIMFNNITEHGTCTVVFTVVSAILLFLLAIPPTFSEMAILGYIDFGSIMAAILITIIATGITSSNQPGGLAAVDWSAWPKEDLSFYEAFIAVTNIVFAYSFALCQFSFMDEMHTPADFTKSIVALGVFEIILYTLTGALIYAFVGSGVASPALLSAGHTVSKVAFGVAIPVIFISGSINTVVVARYIHDKVHAGSIIRLVNTPMGWVHWIGLDAVLTVFAWVIAGAVPFFSDLLAIVSALFISGFSFYFPAIMWFQFIKEGPWNTKKNLALGALNILCFLIGIVILGAGTYAAIEDIKIRYKNGTVNKPFSCAA